MTKTQEIKELDRMIKKFGLDSYIGPWLKESRPAIVWAIENDWNIGKAYITEKVIK